MATINKSLEESLFGTAQKPEDESAGLPAAVAVKAISTTEGETLQNDDKLPNDTASFAPEGYKPLTNQVALRQESFLSSSTLDKGSENDKNEDCEILCDKTRRLYKAIRKGDEVDQDVRDAVDQDPSIVNNDVSNRKPVAYYAVIHNRVNFLKFLKQKGADLENYKEKNTESNYLLLAAKNLPENIEDIPNCTFTYLLDECGFNQRVNEANKLGLTALHIACKRCNLSLVKKLLSLDPNLSVDVNCKDKNGDTPLHFACALHTDNIAKLLIEKNAKIDAENDRRMTPLHIVATNAHVLSFVIKRSLEECPGLVNQANKYDDTPLLLAVRHGNLLATEKFLEYKEFRESDACTRRDQNILHLAVCLESSEILLAICQYPSLRKLINKCDDFGTPLHYAARHNRCKAIEQLLQCGADIESLSANDKTPLFIAAYYGSVDAFELLLEKGAHVVVHRQRLLHYIFYSKAVKMLETLISKHYYDTRDLCRTEVFEKDKNTLLHIVCKHGYYEFAKVLLDNNIIYIKTLNENEATCLHLAAKKGHVRIIEDLLITHDSVTWKDKHGSTPLHYAAINGQLGAVMLLVNRGSDVDALDEKGRTPLCYAASSLTDTTAIIKLLLENNANVNGIGDGLDGSPLWLALEAQNIANVKLLLRYDAKVILNDKDKDGKSFQHNLLVKAVKTNFSEGAMAIIQSDYHWKTALRFGSGIYKNVPMNILIEQAPDVAIAALNRGISMPPDDDSVLHFYYEYIDTHDFVLEKAGEESGWSPIQHASDSKRQKFDFDKHPLNVMVENCVESGNEQLLTHPLVSVLLEYKWRSFGCFIYYGNLAVLFLFLIFLTAFALVSPSPHSVDCIAFNHTCRDTTGDERIFLYRGAFIIIMILLVVRGILVIGKLTFQKWYFFCQLKNWMELYNPVLAVLFVTFGISTDCHCLVSWQWQIGALCIFTSWLILAFSLKRIPHLGIYLIMFLQVLLSFMKVILLAALIVISFGLTFYILLNRPGEHSAFSYPGRSFLKTIVMATGEFGFNDIFYYNTEDVDTDLYYPMATYLVWIVFIIFMPILLTNLLVGLAVDDIQLVQKRAKLTQIELKINMILELEGLCTFLGLSCLPCKRRDKYTITKRVPDKTKYDVFETIEVLFWGNSFKRFINAGKKIFDNNASEQTSQEQVDNKRKSKAEKMNALLECAENIHSYLVDNPSRPGLDKKSTSAVDESSKLKSKVELMAAKMERMNTLLAKLNDKIDNLPTV